MSRLVKLLFLLCLFLSLQAPAYAQQKGETRGELLYSTYCSGCHTAQIHWRDKKLVTDWASLRVQVRRWQADTGLGWSEEEVDATARYLNAAYYHFPDAEQRGLREEKDPLQALRKE